MEGPPKGVGPSESRPGSPAAASVVGAFAAIHLGQVGSEFRLHILPTRYIGMGGDDLPPRLEARLRRSLHVELLVASLVSCLLGENLTLEICFDRTDRLCSVPFRDRF